MKLYDKNPKTHGSGILCAIPQEGKCPINCPDCFFNERPYTNGPNIPWFISANQVLRVNDGNDSNVNRADVEEATLAFADRRFFNTSIPKPFDEPWVLTVNPAKMTNTDFHRPHQVSDIDQLMFVRFRINTANRDLAYECVKAYTALDVPVVLTFLAYYKEPVPKGYEHCYHTGKRTTNTYQIITFEAWDQVMREFHLNPLVYSCSGPDNFKCKHCGTCLREFYRIKNK